MDDDLHNKHMGARDLHRKKDYVTSFKIFKELADDNELSDAQYDVGICYQEGFGTDINMEISFEYFKKASEQGHMHALFNLAVMLENGTVCEKILLKPLIYMNY
jgi:hypothetical protein